MVRMKFEHINLTLDPNHFQKSTSHVLGSLLNFGLEIGVGFPSKNVDGSTNKLSVHLA